MKLIAIINLEIPLGKSLNALAHMTLGLGHRLKGTVDVNIFFGTGAQVREFRELSSIACKKNPDTAVFSDFPHTMSGGDTDKQLIIGQNTPESELKYYGSCYISNEVSQDLITLTKNCQQLKDYMSISNKLSDESKNFIS